MDVGRPEESFALGPLVLLRRLGRGGMAEVWRALHRPSGEAVAVKLVSRARASTRGLRTALRNEVRTMAGIRHPGIVRVLDYGDVSPEDAAASAGRLEEGSPYLVMELVEGGPLRPMASFEELRGLLLHLLASLGHAHARGVIHRDLKPTNILLASREGPPRPKLMDFGIAYALHAEDEDAHLGAGTPRYMAPEQILGDIRDQGPWTDLYSLGCVAYLLACNRAPYAEMEGQAIYLAQCQAPPPLFLPAFPVPVDLEPWLLRLLAKRPRDRFRMAADAAHALLGLRGPTREPASIPERRVIASGPAEDLPTVVTGPPSIARALPPPDPEEEERAAEPPPLPPIPASWRLEEEAPVGLEGVGLGLWGLRTLPLVDRERERDLLWESLRAVRAEGRPRAVLLRGPAGVGKSRLAHWLAERALEVGAAEALYAEHAEVESARHGLRGMMLRHLRAHGLDAEGLRARLGRAFSELPEERRERELRDLAMLFSPAEADATRRFARPEELYAVYRRALAHLARERPAILVLDDLQWGRAALGLVEHLLAARPGASPPILLVLVVGEEELRERPGEAAAIAAIGAHERCKSLPIAALAPRDHLELVQGMLGLAEDVARDVAARTEGHPAFAVQLVGDWVERGLLVPREGGLCLAGVEAGGEGGGAADELPEDLRTLFAARIELLVKGIRGTPPEDARAALEIGACLGREVDAREWRAACHLAGLRVPEDLLDALATSGIAEVHRDQGRFSHALLRESLLQRARREGRLLRWHRICARTLRRLYEVAEVNARLAYHLYAAERWEEAYEAVEGAIDQRSHHGITPEVRGLLELREGALRALGAGPSDPRVRMGQLRMAEIVMRRGDVAEAERVLAEVAESAPEGEDPLRAHRAWLRGVVAHRRGELRAGAEAFEEALEALGPEDRSRLKARCYNGLAECHKRMGKLELAKRTYREAEEIFLALGAHYDHGRVLSDLADALLREGRIAGAVTLLARARELLEERGDRYTLGILANIMGDIERRRGRLDLAERRYSEALEELDELGIPEAAIVRLNLALVLVDREQHEAASALLVVGERELEESRRGGYLPFAYAARLPCAAALGDLPLFDDRLERLEAALEEHRTVDEEIAAYVERGAERAEAAGELARAARAYAIARAQWSALGREEEAARCARGDEGG